ncbi:MAG TPA: isoprenylcysteine carboxylmethyltransferase family protein [Bryobacteraceae bacterium]|nr:isoprenylcysteine carboxylmethyltransferase family protein [Bryobacteraceae bacterium]
MFTLYWSAAAKKSSAAKKSESRESRQWHVLLVNVALLLIVVPVPGMRQRFLPVSAILVGVGLAVQIASGLLGVWARRHLGANWSGEITIKVDHSLIRTGPYSRLRHPIYTAMLGMFAGSAIPRANLGARSRCVLRPAT